jgi:hypothetical protein
MSHKVLGVFLCLPLLAVAAPSPGTIAAGGSLKLNGVEIPASAATSTPVHLGDEIATAESQSVIRLDEYGAVITLNPGSSIQTGESDHKPFVRLTAGSLQYQLTATSKLVIFKQNQIVKAGRAGSVSIGSHTKPIVIAGAGGAAAVGTTVALAKRSKTCPNGETKDHDCGKGNDK